MDIGLLASRCLRISKQWKQSQGSLHWKRQVFMESSWSNSQRSESSLFLLKSFLQTLKIQSGLSPLPLPWSIVVWIQRCSWKSRVSTVKRERESALKVGLNVELLAESEVWILHFFAEHSRIHGPVWTLHNITKRDVLEILLLQVAAVAGLEPHLPSQVGSGSLFSHSNLLGLGLLGGQQVTGHDVMTSWLMTKFVNLSISRAW